MQCSRLQYDTWILGPAEIPPRSVLYHLLPVGVGTPGVESLTGYMARLAAAHAVSVATLCARELLPRMVGSRSAREFRNALHYAYDAHILNGMGRPAEEFSGLLETLTGCRGLRALTMLGWKGAISHHDVTRSTRAWCSWCYGEWRRAGEIIYEPLLWTIRLASVCLRHRRRLEEACPHCRRAVRVVSGRSQPGFCSRCSEWLGVDPPEPRPNGDGMVDEGWELWVGAQLGMLLSSTAGLGGCACGEILRENLRHCIDDLAEGNHSRLYRIAQLSNKSVAGWINGYFRPELLSLMRLCHRLRIPLVRFLTERLCSGDPDWERARHVVKDHARRTVLRYSREQASPDPEVTRTLRSRSKTAPERLRLPEKIRRALEAALDQEEPPSLRNIATRLGFRGFDSLTYRFPDLTQAVVAKRAERWRARIRAAEAVLKTALHEDRPPSIEEVTQRVGQLSVKTLQDYFPVYWQQLTARRAEHRRRTKEENIRAILLAGLQESPPPSFETLALRAWKSAEHVHLLFPGLYREVLHRHADYWRQQRARKRQAVRDQVELVARKICSLGLYPSRERVRSFLADTSVSEHAIKETLTYLKKRLQLPGSSSVPLLTSTPQSTGPYAAPNP